MKKTNPLIGKLLSGRVYPDFFKFNQDDIILNV
jgi:hypothetical protein